MKINLLKIKELKRKEAELREQRYELEKAVYESLECKQGKSKTHKLDGFKVLIKKPTYYKLDQDVWNDIEKSIPVNLRPLKIPKPEIDVRGYEWIRENEKEVYEKIAQAVTVKYGKPSVSIEEDYNV